MMVNAKSPQTAGTVNGHRRERRGAGIFYPEGDDRPIGETQFHGEVIFRTLDILRHRYADRPDVYVWTNLNVYPEEGNRKRYLQPDLFVAFGAPKEPKRRVYKLWEEPVPPTVVFEITSVSTRTKDCGPKLETYAAIGVREVYLFDPLDEYMRPALRGFRLAGDAYEEMTPDAGGGVASEALGLRLVPAGEELELFELSSGDRLLDSGERIGTMQRQVEAEVEVRRQLERRVAELEAERGQAEQP